VRVWWVPAVTLVLLVSACGSSGGGGTGGSSSRLSASAYKAHLKTLAKESNTAQHAVEKGFRATSVPQLVTVLTAFGTAERRIGDEVAALNPPTNAEAANNELAKGQQDTASEVQALLPKIKKMPSAQAAIAYLSKKTTTKGGHEIDQGLAKLKQLGYIKNVS
jgi:hypothetical protein